MKKNNRYHHNVNLNIYKEGSRLFYMREEIKARKEEKLSKLREETD